jgi:ABC-type ATPase with predicted acetyltransferase domain
MRKWECTVCGYIHEGDEPPEKCPVCGAEQSKFIEIEPEKILLSALLLMTFDSKNDNCRI